MALRENTRLYPGDFVASGDGGFFDVDESTCQIRLWVGCDPQDQSKRLQERLGSSCAKNSTGKGVIHHSQQTFLELATSGDLIVHWLKGAGDWISAVALHDNTPPARKSHTRYVILKDGKIQIVHSNPALDDARRSTESSVKDDQQQQQQDSGAVRGPVSLPIDATQWQTDKNISRFSLSFWTRTNKLGVSLALRDRKDAKDLLILEPVHDGNALVTYVDGSAHWGWVRGKKWNNTYSVLSNIQAWRHVVIVYSETGGVRVYVNARVLASPYVPEATKFTGRLAPRTNLEFELAAHAWIARATWFPGVALDGPSARALFAHTPHRPQGIDVMGGFRKAGAQTSEFKFNYGMAAEYARVEASDAEPHFHPLTYTKDMQRRPIAIIIPYTNFQAEQMLRAIRRWDDPRTPPCYNLG